MPHMENKDRYLPIQASYKWLCSSPPALQMVWWCWTVDEATWRTLWYRLDHFGTLQTPTWAQLSSQQLGMECCPSSSPRSSSVSSLQTSTFNVTWISPWLVEMLVTDSVSFMSIQSIFYSWTRRRIWIYFRKNLKISLIWADCLENWVFIKQCG